MYAKILAKIVRVIEAVLMILLAVSIVVVTAQVFWRYVLNDPLSWSEQTARCLFIWMMMLAVPVLFYRNGAVAFDLLVEMLPHKAQDIVKIIVKLIILGFAVFYLIHSIALCVETGNRLLTGLEIPMNCLYAAPPVAMVGTILVMLKQIGDCIVDYLKKEEA